MDTPSVLARSQRPARRGASGPGRTLRAVARSLALALALTLTLSLTLTVLAPASPVAAVLLDTEIVDAIEVDGRLIEIGGDGELEAAADRANAAGIAFAWLDRSGDDGTAVSLADITVEELSIRGSRYHTVLVFLGNSFAASSLTRSQADLDEALDAAVPGFADGDMGRGVDDFTNTLTASGSSGATTVPPANSEGTSDGGGIGFGTILVVVAALGGGFLLIRRTLQGRREREQAEIDLAEDRAEIEEQLKNNADRVIALGDRVIAKGDRELIVLYEEASAAYQEVSQRIDEAENAAEVDELDDLIDNAEWQFEVIEAELDGRARPKPPTPDDVLTGDPDGGAVDDRDPSDRDPGAADSTARRMPPPPEAPSNRGAGRDVVTSPRTGRTYPRSSSRTPTRRRSGGGLGSVLGGGLGGVLADVVLGGGLGGLGGSSRRTTRRRTTSRGGGLGAGGLGGGVLRRSGSSNRSRSSSRSRSGSRSSRSSGGRSVGGGSRSRSRGGRRL